MARLTTKILTRSRLSKEPKIDKFAKYLHESNRSSFFDFKYIKPNKSNLSFGAFIRKLKLEDNVILGHLLYLHFSKSGLCFEDWNI